MKTVLFLAVIFVLAMDCRGQGAVEPNRQNQSKPGSDYQGGVPNFPGGNDSLIKFFQDNIHFPDSLKMQKITGKVFVSFIVDTSGTVKNLKLLKGMNKVIDEEVLRVASIMPKWMPAIVKGQKTETTIALSVPIFTGNREE